MDKDSKKNRPDGKQREARVKIRFASPEALEKEYTSNISKGGMFLGTRKTYPLRSRIIFKLVFPGSEESLELTGEVVHVVELQPGMDASKAGVGIQFIDLNLEKRAIIENYISSMREGEDDKLELAPELPEEQAVAIDPGQRRRDS